MPCSDSSSSIFIKLDHEERFVTFQFAKITCGREITAETAFSKYLKGKTLDDILALPYMQAVTDLNLTDDEAKFVLHLEWDALRAAIAQYQGRQEEGIDFERCQITSIAHTDQGIEIAEIVLPPKEMPKILPCSLGDKQQSQQQQQ
ncbi:MAG: iron-sulfur cluster assembly scaffold protein [Candidatus Omnitrophica bacterium]|nr:iron-sulfur cluster assembly scaffold protein [Candidatus Omnitrophota bacterium]